MGTVIIIAILLGIGVVGVRSYMKKLSSGCCSADSGEKKIKVADKDMSHYPYHADLSVDGMTCGHCKLRVENALNSIDGVWAKANSEKGTADVKMKSYVSDEQLRDAVSRAGYTVTAIKRN